MAKILSESQYTGKKTMRLDYVTYKTLEEIKDIERFTDNELMECLIEAVAVVKKRGYTLTPADTTKDQRYNTLLRMFIVNRA